MKFDETLRNSRFLLAEGSVVERLRRMPGVVLHPVLEHAPLIYQPDGARRLKGIYREYLDIATAAGVPMLCFSATWRASAPRLARAGLDGLDVNGDAVRFLSRIRSEYAQADRIFIGGLLGCAGDAYRPEESLDPEAARRYHQPQVRALSAAGADFLFASTLPAAPEAAGLAAAMSECGIPYLLSFIVRRDGRLLDGTPLASLIDLIDAQSSPAPTAYMLNCVHPSVCEAALETLPAGALRRVAGLQANTSRRDPVELDGLDHLDSEDPDALGAAIQHLQRRFGLRVAGGCCGTDARHIRAIAARCFPQP